MDFNLICNHYSFHGPGAHQQSHGLAGRTSGTSPAIMDGVWRSIWSLDHLWDFIENFDTNSKLTFNH